MRGVVVGGGRIVGWGGGRKGFDEWSPPYFCSVWFSSMIRFVVFILEGKRLRGGYEYRFSVGVKKEEFVHAKGIFLLSFFFFLSFFL